VLRKTCLPASVLGLPASGEAVFKVLASDPGFQAVLLSVTELRPPDPQADDAIDALA
jgi:hypothetical protein